MINNFVSGRGAKISHSLIIMASFFPKAVCINHSLLFMP
jgi:hypothetical protein